MDPLVIPKHSLGVNYEPSWACLLLVCELCATWVIITDMFALCLTVLGITCRPQVVLGMEKKS